MSAFDDQMDDWMENGCVGNPDDYYAGGIGPWVDEDRARRLNAEIERQGSEPATRKPRTEAQRAKQRRYRARRRERAAAEAQQAEKSQ